MDSDGANPASQPCVLLIFGASGDLTKRLLVPALYNLACDGLLSENFALLGAAMDPLTTESFRQRMSEDIQTGYDSAALDGFAAKARAWQAEGDAYIFMINGAKVRAPAAALELSSKLAI